MSFSFPTSKCPACSNNSFELKVIDPKGSRYKVSAIQCSSCGAVVGVMDYYPVGAIVESLQQDVKKLTSEISTIHSYVATLMSRVG